MERSRFKTDEQQQTASGVQIQQAKAAAEFASVEEVLRFDAAQVAPPPKLDDRVKKSLEAEPALKKSWWERIFG